LLVHLFYILKPLVIWGLFVEKMRDCSFK